MYHTFHILYTTYWIINQKKKKKIIKIVLLFK